MMTRRNEFSGIECTMGGNGEYAAFRWNGHTKADLDGYMVGYLRLDLP